MASILFHTVFLLFIRILSGSEDEGSGVMTPKSVTWASYEKNADARDGEGPYDRGGKNKSSGTVKMILIWIFFTFNWLLI